MATWVNEGTFWIGALKSDEQVLLCWHADAQVFVPDAWKMAVFPPTFDLEAALQPNHVLGVTVHVIP